MAKDSIEDRRNVNVYGRIMSNKANAIDKIGRSSNVANVRMRIWNVGHVATISDSKGVNLRRA